MTVSENENVVYNWNGDNSTTTFDFDFLIEDESQLVVMYTNANGIQTTLEKDVDYTIAEIGNENGSHINYPIEGSTYSVLQSDEIISLVLNLPIIQDTPYAESEKLVKSRLERNFDYLTRLVAIQERKIERAVKTQEGSSVTPDELITALNTAAKNAQNSAIIAEEQSVIAQQYATSAQESEEIATQKTQEVVETYNKAMTDIEEIGKTTKSDIQTIASETTTALNELSTTAKTEINDLTATSEEDIQSLSDSQQDSMSTLATQLKTNIQALGIFMEDNRLFYYDSEGVKREFRNDFGGIAPMAVKHKEIKKVDSGFALTWTDPDDSTYESNLYCKWDNTIIVRKLGAYPESPFDGDIVVTSKVRNQYANTSYVDEVDNTKDYKYRAFPCSTNKVYNLEDSNKFGQWIYSFTRIMNETVPAEKIVYRGTNEHYANAYTNYSNNNKVELGDWENAPFLLKDRLAPCAVSFAGELKYFLDVNDYTKKEDGTSSDNTNTASELNFFMRIKLLYRRKRKNADGNTEVDISNEKVNDEYKPYGGFIKTDGTLREYIYLPIYRGSLINSKVRSISGQTPMSGQTAPNERTYCKNNGSGHDMITRADRELIEDIYMLMFKNMDSQTALGAGKSNGGSDVGACLKSGTMDKKGLFHGSTSTAEGIKFLGMENRYASQWERILGEVLVNGVRKVKLCQGTSDGSTVDDFNFTGDGYITLSELPTISGSSGGYISKEQTVDDIGTFPVVVSGSSSTNECDGMWFNNSGTMVAVCGGSSLRGSLCGFFCSSLHLPASSADWSIGSSNS